LDNTKTTSGARLLRNLLLNPTNDLSVLEKRIKNVQYYFDNLEKTKEIHNIF
jgi:DNA mismatch repair ATPase MutS